MAIRLVIDDRVKFKVSGTFADRNGTAQPFSFSLVTDRIDVDAIDEVAPESLLYIDFFASRTHDWTDVLGDDNKPLPYSEAELRKLFKLPGVAALTWRRYLEEIGAKAKN